MNDCDFVLAWLYLFVCFPVCLLRLCLLMSGYVYVCLSIQPPLPLAHFHLVLPMIMTSHSGRSFARPAQPAHPATPKWTPTCNYRPHFGPEHAHIWIPMFFGFFTILFRLVYSLHLAPPLNLSHIRPHFAQSIFLHIFGVFRVYIHGDLCMFIMINLCAFAVPVFLQSGAARSVRATKIESFEETGPVLPPEQIKICIKQAFRQIFKNKHRQADKTPLFYLLETNFKYGNEMNIKRNLRVTYFIYLKSLLI